MAKNEVQKHVVGFCTCFVIVSVQLFALRVLEGNRGIAFMCGQINLNAERY